MKRLIWLLAMYVLVLTGLPCPDGDCHAHATSVATESSHADDGHQTPVQPVLPLRHLRWLHDPQPLVEALPANSPSPLLTRSAFAYQPIRHDDVSGSFWQPPKQ